MPDQSLIVVVHSWKNKRKRTNRLVYRNGKDPILKYLYVEDAKKEKVREPIYLILLRAINALQMLIQNSILLHSLTTLLSGQ